MKQKLALLLIFISSICMSQITLKDVITDGTYSAKSVSGFNTFDNDNKYLISHHKKNIVSYSLKTGEKLETLFTTDDCDEISTFFKYKLSKNEDKILIFTKKKSIYRHSYTCNVYVWNIKTKKILLVGEKIQIPSFSPDGKKVAYIKDNNIYFKNLKTNKVVKVTSDGKFNKILNGIPDWVYEEEFSYNKAYKWTGNSSYIAYIKFNEQNVKVFNMTKYSGMNPTIKANDLYPENYSFKYPKAGEVNSEVSMHIYNCKSKETSLIKLQNDFKEFYLPRIQLTKDKNTLCVLKINRLQNALDVFLVNINSGKEEILFRETNKRFIEQDFLDNIIFSKNNEFMYFISERNKHYNHIYKFDLKTKKTLQITKGEWGVTSFYGIDNNTIYFSSTEKSPLERNLFSININGKERKILTKNKGWNYTKFTKSLKYYTNNFSNSFTPNQIALFNSKGKKVRELEDNSKLLSLIKGKPLKEFFKFKTSAKHGIVELNGWMIKPTNFNKNQQYPVLMTQYSGPGSQQVKNSFSFDWYNYLASEGYIVVCVDGRGTGGKDENFKKSTYLDLGRLETIDQIESAKYLSKLPFVNKSKITIWGWSFGGFTVLNAMQKGNGIFNAGIAIAPVTNWKYYDSVYTERYLRTPQENKKGYDSNSPMESAKDLKGNLLIVAGTADDNVHFQNTIEYCEKLVQNNILFEMQIYNNRNHSIYGGNTRLHLYRTFMRFLNNNK